MMFNNKAIVKAGIGLFLAAGIAACSSTANVGVSEQGYDEYREYLETNSKTLAGKVSIASMKSKMAGDLMQVQAELRNNTRKTRDFKYKFKFYDESGFELNAGGRAWTPIVIVGGESKSVQATAPDPRATSFKIYVQD